MKIKAARDVLDFNGKHWVEFTEADTNVSNFDPAKIVKEVVETGDFKADPAKIEHPAFDSDVVTKLTSSFSAGRKFCWNTRGTVKMIACEFIPVGLQYVIYDRSCPSIRTWVKTDEDLMEN